MIISDKRLEEIRAWLAGDSQTDASPSPQELAAIAGELKQVRLRISSKSRGSAPTRTVAH